MKMLCGMLVCGLLVAAGAASAGTVTVTMHRIGADGVGNILGTLVFEDTARGLKVWPNLRGLRQGQHGTHVHQNPNCGPAEKNGKTVPGLAAGSHFDPEKTGRHEGPAGQGHLGDLPVLYVGAKGRATRTMLAPRLKTADLTGRAIVIHSGGDNYSDAPKKLGGGGSRVACGVVVN